MPVCFIRGPSQQLRELATIVREYPKGVQQGVFCHDCVQVTVKKVTSEAELNADLRRLTEKSRQLREELRESFGFRGPRDRLRALANDTRALRRRRKR